MLHLILAALAVVIAANVAAIIVIAMTLARFRKIILGKNQGMTVEGVIGAKATPEGALVVKREALSQLATIISSNSVSTAA